MRILVISHNFPHRDDPTCGIFVALQLVEMQKLGADITVLVPIIWAPRFVRLFKRWEAYSYKWKLCKFEGLEASVISFLRSPGKWFYRWDGLSLFWAAKRLVRKMHREKPFDVIYGRGFFPEADLAVRLSSFLRIPAVGVGIGTDINLVPSYSKTIYRHFVWIANNLDYTMATGRGVADRIDAVNNKHTSVVHGVVNLEKFAPISDYTEIRNELGIGLDKFVALYAGHLIKAKGIYEMVEAFSRIQEVIPNVLLMICGEGVEESGLKKLIEEKKASDAIKLVGAVDPTEMHKWMQASDLFVFPSYREGMPNAVMEAMACGIPVVASAVGGLPDAVGGCNGAILVQPKCVDELEQAILKVTRDNQLRQRMGAAARKTAEEKFGVRRNAQMVLDYISGTVAKVKVK